jgi:hypothetical protein
MKALTPKNPLRFWIRRLALWQVEHLAAASVDCSVALPTTNGAGWYLITSVYWVSCVRSAERCYVGWVVTVTGITTASLGFHFLRLVNVTLAASSSTSQSFLSKPLLVKIIYLFFCYQNFLKSHIFICISQKNCVTPPPTTFFPAP